MALSQHIHKSISTIHLSAQQSCHRRMIVLSGTENWCLTLVESLLTLPCCQHALLISDRACIPNLNSIPSRKLAYHLGSECETLVWDGFSGLSPDALGIASGLLKGGGLFILFIPSLNLLRTQPDKDYLRMCSEHDNVNSCHTFFLQRLVNQITSSEDVFLIEEGKAPLVIDSEPVTKALQLVQLPSSDQLETILAIKKVSFGHRHRPLVIKANRGRGKSSALGLAAAELYIETQQKMLITAPSKKACDAAFQHYKAHIKTHFFTDSEQEKALNAFQFVAIDLIVTEFPACHLLFIDEAAAIPVPLLTEMLKHYARIVFSTTIHGYEGSGQGFAIRFQKTLTSIRPNWKSISLSTPIRWSENDPLEAWFFKLLILNAELSANRKAFSHQNSSQVCSSIESPLSSDIAQSSLAQTEWLDQLSLSQNEQLLEQLIALLVSAHYQTSPSDLRLILDHPKIRILIIHESAYILGVCLLIEEGGIESVELAENIISGKRRPRGQLFPQALSASTANAEFLQQTSYRIMRIAVHPDHQSQGLGSRLLKDVAVLAKENMIDSVSTSYGLTTELLAFWHKNNFKTLKLGLKVDSASGLQSIMMMQGITNKAMQLCTESSQQFLAYFRFNLNRVYQSVDSHIIVGIFQTLSKVELNLPSVNNKKIDIFANALGVYEDSDVDIFHYTLSKIASPTWKHLHVEHQSILVIKVLQNRDQLFCLKHLNLAGKKQLDLALREAVMALLALQ